MASPATLFTDPKAFFEERSFGLGAPIAVIGSIVIVRLLTEVIRVFLLRPAVLPEMAGPDAQAVAGPLSGLVFPVLAAIIGPLITWGLFAGNFYAISELIGDDPAGGFTDVLAVTAYGLVPRLITTGLGLVLSVAGFVLIGPLGVRPSVMSIVLVAGPVVGLAMTLLSASIWANGLTATRGITTREGYICTLPIVLFGLLVTVLSIIFELLAAATMF